MKSDKKTSVRLPSKRLEQIDEISSKNGNCSRAKVIKDALDLVLEGKSDINFEFKNDYSKQPRKNIEFKDDHKILADCPHCNGKIRLDPEHYKKFKKTILPSFIPAYRCGEPGCNDLHPNPNYKHRITAYCSRCGQFAKNDIGPCTWCCYINTLQLVNENWLDQIGIPRSNS